MSLVADPPAPPGSDHSDPAHDTAHAKAPIQPRPARNSGELHATATCREPLIRRGPGGFEFRPCQPRFIELCCLSGYSVVSLGLKVVVRVGFSQNWSVHCISKDPADRHGRHTHRPKKTWLGSPLAQRFSRPCVGCGLPQRVWGPATAQCRNHPPPPGWSGGGRTNAPRDHGRSGRRRRKEVTLARPRTRLRGWGPAGGQSVLTAGRGPHLQVSGSPERISLPPNRGERREVMDRSSGRRATARSPHARRAVFR